MSEARCYVIAEAGVNHNGLLHNALLLADAAREAGADAVKYQTFVPSALATTQVPKAAYQQTTTGTAGSQLQMLERLALSHQDHWALKAHCEDIGIEFLSSPFDPASLAFLVNELRLPVIKFGSGELTNGPLLLTAARAGKTLILSTGMSTLEEIRTALAVVTFGYLYPDTEPRSLDACLATLESSAGAALRRQRVSLLQCTTEYPCPYQDVNLRAMDTIATTFGLPVGLSDHTIGSAVAIAAVARGASIVEKHFTLDSTQVGPDHKASIEPLALRAMVADIRRVEAALGSATKAPAASEAANVSIARKSLVAARPITAHEPYSAENLACKRAGAGVSPMLFWDMLGRSAPRAYAIDEPIDP